MAFVSIKLEAFNWIPVGWQWLGLHWVEVHWAASDGIALDKDCICLHAVEMALCCIGLRWFALVVMVLNLRVWDCNCVALIGLDETGLAVIRSACN